MEHERSDSVNRTAENSFSRNALNTFNELRRTGQLCDVVIKVDNQLFPCHRTIMSACSPYFRALFTNELFEMDRREIIIPCVSPEVMQNIIDYAYTQECKVTPENVEQLLPAADQFHVSGLVGACCDFLCTQLSPENAIGIYKFAQAYFCHNLAKRAFRYVMQNFCKVYIVSNEYLQLSIDEVFAVLESDELNVKTEEIVFDAILRWIDYDAERRKHLMPKLLRCMRLGLLTTQYFVEKVKHHPYVKDHDGCKPIIIETLKFLHDLDLDEDKEVDLSNPLAKPRVPHDILFAIGGWSGGSAINNVETYDTRADRWIEIDALDTGPRAYHGTVCVDNLIYVIGGFDGVEYFNSVRCFDPVARLWSEAAPMYAKRCYVSTTVLDGVIYALGGFDGQNRQNTAERYVPRKNQWSLIAPMIQQRSDASSAAYKGKVYICGGFNGQECLSSAETYDPAANQWTMIAPMRNRRSGVGVIVYRDAIFALGGFNGVSRMKSGERYSPATNSWQTIAEMYNARSNFGIEVIDDMVFLIGGFNGSTTIFHVECYDGATDEWFDATDMNQYKSALGTCVVTSLPNVWDYIHKDRNKGDPDPAKRKARAASAQ